MTPIVEAICNDLEARVSGLSGNPRLLFASEGSIFNFFVYKKQELSCIDWFRVEFTLGDLRCFYRNSEKATVVPFNEGNQVQEWTRSIHKRVKGILEGKEPEKEPERSESKGVPIPDILSLLVSKPQGEA